MKTFCLVLSVVLGGLLVQPAEAAITTTGSVVSVSDADLVDSAAVTVPGDATIAVVFWCAYSGGNVEMAAGFPTLNGQAMTQLVNTAGSAVATNFGAAILINPSTGSQTFAWEFDNDGGSNGACPFVLRFLKTASAPTVNGDVLVDSDISSNETGSIVTIGPTVTSVTGGYVVGAVDSNAATQTPLGAPGGSGQTVDGDNVAGPGGDPAHTDLAHEDTPGASTTTFTGTLAYGATIVVSLRDYSPGGAPAVPRLLLLGVG